MTRAEIEEKLRKLAPVDHKRADLGWLFYLSIEGEDELGIKEGASRPVSLVRRIFPYLLQGRYG